MNMNQADTIDVDTDEVTPEAVFNAVQDVIADAAEYLSDWMRRFDQQLANHTLSATPESVLRERMQEFEQTKNSWEAKRQSEEARLKEKADQITEAWLRLEDEQRTLLQMKEMSALAGRDRGAVAKSSTAHAKSAVATSERQLHNASYEPVSTQPRPLSEWERRASSESMTEFAMRGQAGESVGREAGADAVGRVDGVAGRRPELESGPAVATALSATRESAVRQFQRLRREIESSRSSSSPT